VIDEEPIFAVDDAPAGAFYLVMTHSHALDLEIVARALQRSDACFVGLIGSETKAAKFRARLTARGIDPSRLVSPIGLFKSGKHPAEVAVSAVAQVLVRPLSLPTAQASCASR
jgi:xanthine dehydrogenase accessory factor